MWIWIIYVIFLALAVLADYKIFATSSVSLGYKKALQSMVFWLVITMISALLVYVTYERDAFKGYMSHDIHLSGLTAVSLFISGYLVEQSLSLDNIFVIAYLLNYFQVPQKNQSGLLSIGIWSAIILRSLLIIAGIWLINSISWMVYALGILLIYSGIKIFKSDSTKPQDPNKSFVIRLVRKWLPVTKGFYENRFFIKKMGKWAVTPLFLTLIAIELTDILFALDSIPAIFALTTDPFLVMSSNILAVANLRALFNILSRALEKLEYIHYALSILLVLIGIKIMISHYVEIPIWLSMSLIFTCLGSGVIYSLWRTSKEVIKA
ncbi:MAG: TerC/Alx family metal homeostasis membrane protein [Bacteroidota bacterium]|nr:TerC/Alx family metal homeostasis membrane protein [Bacteroidota bacterium]